MPVGEVTVAEASGLLGMYRYVTPGGIRPRVVPVRIIKDAFASGRKYPRSLSSLGKSDPPDCRIVWRDNSFAHPAPGKEAT